MEGSESNGAYLSRLFIKNIQLYVYWVGPEKACSGREFAGNASLSRPTSEWGGEGSEPVAAKLGLNSRMVVELSPTLCVLGYDYT